MKIKRLDSANLSKVNGGKMPKWQRECLSDFGSTTAATAGIGAAGGVGGFIIGLNSGMIVGTTKCLADNYKDA